MIKIEKGKISVQFGQGGAIIEVDGKRMTMSEPDFIELMKVLCALHEQWNILAI